MAKNLWEPRAAATQLAIFRDRAVFTKTDDQQALTSNLELQGLSDPTRQSLAGGDADSLAAYDAEKAEEAQTLYERIDSYSYDTRVENLTVLDGEWYSPALVTSFCGEDVGNEAVNSIDGVNSTFWKHTANERHSAVYQIRTTHHKKISKVRWRYGGSALTEQLQSIDVHAAKNLANIDDADNILQTGINPTWPAGTAVWVEHTLAKKKIKASYIKLLFDTGNANNTMQIREFQVWVEPLQPGDDI